MSITRVRDNSFRTPWNPLALLLSIIGCFLVWMPAAHASFISIACETTVEVTEPSQSVTVKFALRNDGDEDAAEVGVSLPFVNRSSILSKLLHPKESVTHEEHFSFSDLRIGSIGKYLLPFHVLYRDTNMFSFSNAQLFAVDRAPLPAKTLLIRFGDSDSDAVDLHKKASVDLEILNIGLSPLQIDSVTVINAQELLGSVKGFQGTKVLAPTESYTVTVRLENANALIGSHYATHLLVEGKIGDVHFAESQHFIVSIVPGFWSPRMVYLISIIAVVCGSLSWWGVKTFFLKKRA